MIPPPVSPQVVFQTAAVLAVMPGHVALVGESGDTLAASAAWQSGVGGIDRLTTPGGASLLDALRDGQTAGEARTPFGPVTWQAQPYEGGDAWLVSLEVPPDDRFRAIFHAMFQFIGLMDPDGTVLEANEAALRFGGLKHADVVGRKLWDCYWFGISEGTRAQVREDVRTAAQGTFVRREMSVWGAGETPVTIDFSIIPVRDAEGRVIRLIPEGRDIRALDETREELRRQSAAAARFGTRLERLYRIGTTVYDSTDALLRDVLAVGCDVLGLPVGAINTFQGASCRYQLVVPSDASIRAGEVLPAGDTLCHYVRERGGTVVYHDLDAVPERHDHFAYREQGVRAYVGTPLRVNGDLYGALFFADLKPHAPYDEAEIRVVELMARRVERALEREHADAELHRSQAHLLHAQRMAHLGTWQWNTETDEITWSDEVYRIFGLEVGDPVDFAAYMERIHPADRAALQAKVQRALEAKKGYETSHRVVLPGGEVRHVDSVGEVTESPDGHLTLTGTAQDVTERVRAGEALRESERRYRFLTENATDIIGRHRPDGTLIYVSPAVETVLARHPDELLGRSLADLVHEDDLAAFRKAFRAFTHQPQQMRHRLRHGEDGGWVWFETRWQALFDPNTDAVTEIISSVRDVSKQVEFEDTLRRREARMRLLSRITAEAAMSADEQVRRAIRMATEELGMDVGVLARKTRNRYCVRALHAPGLALHVGDELPLPRASMLIGPETDATVAISDLRSVGAEHPAYARFGHCGYLGAPIRVKGSFYGAITFWSREPRAAFDPEDREFVLLLGLWLGGLLEKASAEAQVRNSRNLLSTLLTSSLDGIMAFEAVRDEAGEIVDFTWILANPRGAEMIGRSGEYLIGKKLLDELPGNVDSGLFDRYKHVTETGEAFQSEFPYFKDGFEGWFYASVVKLNDGFFITVRNVTVQHEAADALRESEARFRLLADNASDLVCQYSAEGVYTYVSPSVSSLLGYEPAELVGQTPFSIIHPDDAERVHLESQQNMAEGRSAPVLCRVRRSDGTYVWLETLTRLTLDDAGAVLHAQTSSRDVTDRVAAEHDLAHANQTLQQRNRELQDFAYVASHDLQEPLRKIRAFSDLLFQDNGDQLGDDGRHYLSRIDDAATRMSVLISDLLTFSRVTTKGQPFREIDLGAVIQDMLQDLEIALDESEGSVEVGTLPVLEADPLQMRQLFQNLVGNALKFHRPEVPPRIEVRARVQRGAADDREVVVIEVADNGIGFDEKYLDRIFTPFQRLHNRQQYAGTGMGLAICRRIAERHQGQITARSTPGEGTTFVITLPRHHEQTSPFDL